MTSRCSFQYTLLIFCLLSTWTWGFHVFFFLLSFITWEVLLILWTCKWVMGHLPMSHLDIDQISAPTLPQLLIWAHPKQRQSHHTRPGSVPRQREQGWWAPCSGLGLGEGWKFPLWSLHISTWENDQEIMMGTGGFFHSLYAKFVTSLHGVAYWGHLIEPCWLSSGYWWVLTLKWFAGYFYISLIYIYPLSNKLHSTEILIHLQHCYLCFFLMRNSWCQLVTKLC